MESIGADETMEHHQDQAKKPHLEEKRTTLATKRDRLLKSFSDATALRQKSRMHRLCKQLQENNEFLDCLEQIQTETKPLSDGTRHSYVVSSLFLDQCFRDLTADKDEQFFFVTGPEIEGRFVLDQKVEFLHQKRTAVGVTGNLSSTHRILIKLEQFGHRLLAHFHSHPGNGAEATHPSGIDQNFQRRLESAGYPTVAAIFSRDGYIRFFRLDNNLEVQIHGSGVEQIGKDTFRLTNLGQAQG
jgi:hypothetical protein